MKRTCETCRWFGWLWEPKVIDDEEPGMGSCYYPTNKLPTSMAGVANRERESVLPFNDQCPTWEKA